MGFINSVAVAQSLHRNIVNIAVDRLGISRNQEVRKDQTLPQSSLLYRTYLDNFDALSTINKSAADLLAGSLNPLSSELRKVCGEMQGGVIDGAEGTLCPKTDKVARCVRGAWNLLQSTRTDLKRI